MSQIVNDTKKNDLEFNGFIKPEQLIQSAPASVPSRAPKVDMELEEAAGEVTEPISADDIEDEVEMSYEEGLGDGLELSKDLVDDTDVSYVFKKREDTRSRLALIFTFLTFFVFILGMGIAVLDGILRDTSIIQNLSEVVPLISGVFLGSLGFVLGYYFREEEGE